MWGEAHVSLYIGDALFWIEDSEGDVCPVKIPDFIYNPQSNARVVSSRGMIEKGWEIDFYGDELATYTDTDIDLSYRFNIHDINGLSQMIVSDIPDGPDYDKFRGLALTEIPPEVLVRRSDGQDDLESAHPNDASKPSHDASSCEPQTFALGPRQSLKTLWHLRLCHVREKSMDKTKDHPGTIGLHWSKTDKLGNCHSCPAGKAKVFPKKKQTDTPVLSNKGDRIHSDTSGKLSVASKHGALYTHTLVDNASRTAFAKGMIKKSDLTTIVEDFIVDETVGDNADMVVKEIMCDGDRSNYASKQFNDMLKKRHFLTTQKTLMLVFYIFGFYMIMLVLTIIVLLLLYCFDFMP